MQVTLRGVPLGGATRMLLRPNRRLDSEVRHAFVCVADHYEPYFGNAAKRVALDRVDRWVTEYPTSIAGIHDSRGQSPQHTFFYPAEEYDSEVIDRLRGLVDAGLGDIEVHLHHDDETSAGFREQMESFVEVLFERHGLLRKDEDGRIRYAFIHGNWALDNARPDGKWCGVNDELSILLETGCYADMTLPCAPEPGQTRIINSIYYAIDDPERPKSHDTGTLVKVGESPPEDGLLMIQGPLGWNLQNRKWGVLPRLENGDLHGHNGATLSRWKQWLRIAPSIAGRPDWVFIKLHTHGADEVNAELFLEGRMRHFHQQLKMYASQHPELRYYYVTAKQMADMIEQARQGQVEPDFETISQPSDTSTR